MLARRIHHRQLAALQRVELVGVDLVHHLEHRKVARDQQPGLAVGREIHVAGLERHAEGAAHRLLAHVLHVERGLALALGHLHARIEGAQRHHVAQALQQRLVVEQAGPRAHRLAVAIEHADDRIGEVTDLLGRDIDLRSPHLAGQRDLHVAEIGRAAGTHRRRRHVEGQGFPVGHGASCLNRLDYTAPRRVREPPLRPPGRPWSAPTTSEPEVLPWQRVSSPAPRLHRACRQSGRRY
jgi:hypothetical protein